jgi:type II secretory pathway component PulK
MHRSQPKTPAGIPSKRSGFALFITMVCLFIMSLILVTLLRVATESRRQLTFDQYRVQAAWLTEAGIERAVSRIQSDATYEGEVWEVAPADLGGHDGSRVAIRVLPSKDAAELREIRVEATFPGESKRCARQSKQILASVKSKVTAKD